MAKKSNKNQGMAESGRKPSKSGKIKERVFAYATKGQRELLLKIFNLPKVFDDFFFTGGTALSVFYLGHRRSRDLDFFTIKQSLDLKEFSALLENVLKPQQTFAVTETFYSCKIGDIKVDFVIDHLSSDEERPIIVCSQTKIRLDTLDNISINKIASVISRGEAKDIIDLTTLFIKRKLPNFLHLYKKAIQREALLEDWEYVLAFFDHVAENAEAIIKETKNDLLQMLSSVDIVSAISFFQKEIKSFYCKK